MTPRSAPATTASLFAGLLFCICGPALASSGVDVDCGESGHELPVADIAAPSLRLETADHGLTSSAAIDDPDLATLQQSSASPKRLLSPSTDSLLQEIFSDGDATVLIHPSNRPVESTELAVSRPDAAAEAGDQGNTRGNSGLDETAPPRIGVPVTTTRLPGVSATDSSRIRRQMYRTDI